MEEFFRKGEENSILFNLPYNSKGDILGYSAYTINIGAEDESYFVSAKDNVIVGENIELKEEYSWDDGGKEYYCRISVSNKGINEVKNGEVIVYYWKGEEIIGVERCYLYQIIGKDTTEIISTFYSGKSNNYIVPDGVTVDFNYANIRKEN